MNYLLNLFLFFSILEIIFRILYYLKKKKFFFLWPKIKNKSFYFKNNPYYLYSKKENNTHILPSNNFGFVGRKNIELKKNPKTIRLYFVGGSTTEGLGDINDHNSHWPEKLTQKLRDNFPNVKFECLNAACSGYTSAESLSQFMFKGIEFKPDILVVYHGINDAWSVQMQKDFTHDYSHARTFKKFDSLLFKLPSIRILFLYEYVKSKILYLKFQDGLIQWISNPPWKLASNKNIQAVNTFRRNIKNLILISKKWDCLPILIKHERDESKEDVPEVWYDGKKIDKKELFYFYLNKNNESLKNLSVSEMCPYFELGPFSSDCFMDYRHFNLNGVEKFSLLLFKKIKTHIEKIIEEKKINYL